MKHPPSIDLAPNAPDGLRGVPISSVSNAGSFLHPYSSSSPEVIAAQSPLFTCLMNIGTRHVIRWTSDPGLTITRRGAHGSPVCKAVLYTQSSKNIARATENFLMPCPNRCERPTNVQASPSPHLPRPLLRRLSQARAPPGHVPVPHPNSVPVAPWGVLLSSPDA